MEDEIVAHGRPRRAEWVAHTKLGALRHAVAWEPTDGGTRLTEIGDGEFRRLVKLLTPLLVLELPRARPWSRLAAMRA